MCNFPLKDCLSKKVFEYEAKLTIEQVLGKYNFELADKPDLQDSQNDIGVEVAQRIENECTSIFTKYSHPKNDEDKKKRAKKLTEMGCIFMDGIMTQPAYDPIQQTINLFSKKIEKLQNGYKLFKTNNLLIFDSIVKRQSYLNQLLTGFLRKQNNYDIKYDFVYVVSGKEFVIFDLLNKNYTVETYNNQYELGMKAREFVLNNFN